MEQLTVQNIKKSDIYLFVDTHDESNKIALKNIYNNYGFILNSLDDTTLCPSNGAGATLMAMKKPALVSDTSSINFDFLTKRTGGGKRKTRHIKRKSNRRKKTIKRH